MKPTKEQLFDVIETCRNHKGSLEDAWMASLQKWESVRPADEPDRWIPLSERRPTAEDADNYGEVIVVIEKEGAASCGWDRTHGYGITHWRRTNLPIPTEAEIEAKEINDACGGVYSFDSFKAGWLAYKSKTAKLDIHQTTP